MTIGNEIEQIQKQMKIPEYMMCNIMCVSESEYRDIIAGRIVPTVFSIILFIANIHIVPDTLDKYYALKL